VRYSPVPVHSEVWIEKEEEVVERVFSKPNSVFALWIEDTPASNYMAATADMRYWKIPRFIKDS
jgi:hypothetical protein